MKNRLGLLAVAGMMMAAAKGETKTLAPEKITYCAECARFPKGSFCKAARRHVASRTPVHHCEHFTKR